MTAPVLVEIGDLVPLLVRDRETAEAVAATFASAAGPHRCSGQASGPSLASPRSGDGPDATHLPAEGAEVSA